MEGDKAANTIRYREKFHKAEADFCVTGSAARILQAYPYFRIYS